ncbi:MAG TPA: hypothetical protein VGW74_09410 [Propionibacteriaceae bacterium]|nr:hypothetical protein [Propionibacteriaceae bacterium]
MRRLLTKSEWAAEIATFDHDAFHLELQPTYLVEDQAAFQRYLAGDHTPPTDDPSIRDWLAGIARQAAAGKRIERVRVFEDPPTEYQRWERWFGRWNEEAGESIRYMTRQRAHEVGLLPAAGDEDWWLLDSSRLVVTRFDAAGRAVEDELITDPERVTQACTWRSLAIHHSAPADDRSHAS